MCGVCAWTDGVAGWVAGGWLPDLTIPQMQNPLQLRLAEITEMIHAASLFHDDVIDEADTRRGVPSVNKVFGNKLAILAGNFFSFFFVSSF